MKRYYYPNQYITTKDGYSLDITSYGTVYLRNSETIQKLDSALFPYSKVVAVILPNGRLARIKYSVPKFSSIGSKKGLVEV